MTLEENIKAILECNFSIAREEVIEAATKRIMEQIERQNTVFENYIRGNEMTREDAIEDLMIAQLDVFYRPKDDTIDLAIIALENQKSIIKELEKIRAEIIDVEELDHDFEGFYYYMSKAIDIIDKHISELKGEN